MALVAPEAPSEQARRVFQTYDPEGKGCTFFLKQDFIIGIYSFSKDKFQLVINIAFCGVSLQK